MVELISVAARSSSLFNQTLVASLLQPIGRNDTDFKSYRTKVILKIYEQRNEVSGEKELRIEISRSDDFEFLFAEILNNDKYQKLAKEHDLTVDFEAFPRTIVQKLLSRNVAPSDELESIDSEALRKGGPHSFADGKPTEITLILDADRTSCSFELFSKTPISKGRIFAIKLAAVRGDQLIAHLLKTCTSQSAKLSEYQRNYTDLKSELDQIRKEDEKLRKERDEAKKKCEELSADKERIEELEDELELVKEERQNMRTLVEEKEDQLEELRSELEEVRREVDGNQTKDDEVSVEVEVVTSMLREEQALTARLQKEKENLREENSVYRKDIEKSKQILKKYMHNKPSEASVDMRKLRELEDDLREKDGLVITLTQTISALRAELDEEKTRLVELDKGIQQLQMENADMSKKLEMYRLQRFGAYSPAPGPYATNRLGQVPLLNGSTASNVPGFTTNSTTPYLSRTNGYRPVLGLNPGTSIGALTLTPGEKYNAMRPITPAAQNQISPHMGQSSSITPTALRNLSNVNTTTTPILKQSTTTGSDKKQGGLHPTVTFNAN